MLLVEAERVIEVSCSKARELDISMAIAVVNESGILTAFVRMDESELVAVPLAIDKAYTAVINRMSTKELGALCQPGQPLYGLQYSVDGRMIIFAGGVPLRQNGKLCGAVGVSGGTVEQDHECAAAGAEAFQKMHRSCR